LLQYSKIIVIFAVNKKIKKRTFSLDKNSENFDTQDKMGKLFSITPIKISQ